ncbi:MAG TPA: DUF4386 domain-containing protein [Acidobacteriota bacterium]
MTEPIARASPRFKARVAGVLYLIAGSGGGFAEVFVRGRVFVRGDAAATAANILAHESLYRLGGAADLIALACDTALALIFYELLKPVNRSLSLLAAFFRLMHVAILATITLNHFAPLVFLGGSHDLSAFSAAQLQAQTLVSLRLHALGYNICLVFFGFTCLLLGYLIFRSTFLPRFLGVLMAIAGVGYLINSFVHFLAPAFGAYVFRYLLVPCGIGEFVLIVWLLVFGVNAERWKLLLEHLSRKLIFHFLPIVRTGAPSGFYVNLVLPALMIAGLALSLRNQGTLQVQE